MPEDKDTLMNKTVKDAVVANEAEPIVSTPTGCVHKPATPLGAPTNETVKDTVVANEADTVAAQPTGTGSAKTPLEVPIIPTVRRLNPGDVVGDKYEILSHLGKGGMCTVYKAKHLLLKRVVALKMLHEKLVIDKDAIQRFQREAVAICSLKHPNIVEVYGCGVYETVPFMAMQYLEGKSLEQLLENKVRLSKEEALPIFTQILDALAHAHANNIIHRDLKPSNVMLTDSGQVILVDFGIAKILPESGKELQKLTQTGEVFGTVLYMSPEQCRAEDLDARSDLYSMGCLMYEVLDGQPPLRGDTSFNTMSKHLNESPRESKIVAGEFGSVVLSALEKDPAARPQTALELKESLLDPASFTGEPIPKEKQQKPHITKWAILFGTLVLGVVLLGAFTYCNILSPPSRSAQLDKEIESIFKNEPGRMDKIFPIMTELIKSARTTPSYRGVQLIRVRKLEREVASIPEIIKRSRLQLRIVTFYRNLGRPDEAVALAKATIVSLEAFISKEQPHPEHYRDLELACKIVLQLSENDEKLLDTTLGKHCILAQIYFTQGRYAESEKEEKTALTIVQSRPNHNPLSEVLVLDNLASFFLIYNKPKDAEPILLKEWQTCQRQKYQKGWEPNSLLTRTIGSRLRRCYISEGKTEEAARISNLINP